MTLTSSGRQLSAGGGQTNQATLCRPGTGEEGDKGGEGGEGGKGGEGGEGGERFVVVVVAEGEEIAFSGCFEEKFLLI